MIEQLLNNPWFIYGIMPLLIMISRIIDVSMGTIRMILIAKGYKLYAPIIGFFEVIIWLLAIREIMNNLTNWTAYVAYGLGFSLGTYIGMVLEEKLISGKIMVRVVEPKGTDNLTSILRENFKHVTSVKGEGTKKSEVVITFTIIDRKRLSEIIKIIQENNPRAFYTIENIKLAKQNDIIPEKSKKSILPTFKFYRKGK